MMSVLMAPNNKDGSKQQSLHTVELSQRSGNPRCKMCEAHQSPAMGAQFTIFGGKPAMRTRWLDGAAPHKSRRCRDKSRSDNNTK